MIASWENSQVYGLPEAYDVHRAGIAAVSEAATEQVLGVDLPGGYGWEYEEQKEWPSFTLS